MINRRGLANRCAELALRTDTELAVDLLRDTPTHEHRATEQLHAWADAALSYADELPPVPDGPVRERTGGLRGGEVLLAEYHHRTGAITVYRDSIALLAEVAAIAGWRDVDQPALRTAAAAHERAHHALSTQDLNRRLGHSALRLGRWRVRGHVAGADEIVAHRYAHRHSTLRRSPLLLTAALTAALAPIGG